jgi:hypothetical protein
MAEPARRPTDPGDHALPNGTDRTYLSGGGAAAVAGAFLVFLAILLAYFASSTSWAPW